MSDEDATAKIRELNDKFRQSFDPSLGRVCVTRGVQSLSRLQYRQLIQSVKSFADFNSSNDPYNEHDMGRIQLGEERFFWKIDYHDRKQPDYGAEDPADAAATLRIMTIMAVDEY